MESPGFPFAQSLARPRKRRMPQEFKAVSLRAIQLPDSMHLINDADSAVRYWKLAIETGQHHTNERECFYVLALNTRSRILGHYLVATGTLNQLLVHAREVFRIGILVNAYAVLLMHNHPSGDCSPSDY